MPSSIIKTDYKSVGYPHRQHRSKKGRKIKPTRAPKLIYKIKLKKDQKYLDKEQ